MLKLIDASSIEFRLNRMRTEFQKKRASFQVGLRSFLLVLTGFPALSQTIPLGVESRRHIDPIRSIIRKKSFTYAIKDSTQLGLDVYTKGDSLKTRKKPCVLFVFGGDFMAGRRDDSLYNNYFNSLLAHDYVVISMSYLLGLKGVKNPAKFKIAPLEKAIAMAVSDVYDATD